MAKASLIPKLFNASDTMGDILINTYMVFYIEKLNYQPPSTTFVTSDSILFVSCVGGMFQNIRGIHLISVFRKNKRQKLFYKRKNQRWQKKNVQTGE